MKPSENARLIAAAPAMAKALLIALDLMRAASDEFPDDQEWAEAIEAMECALKEAGIEYSETKR